MHIYIELALIVLMLTTSWLVMRKTFIVLPVGERRGGDFYRSYNEQEDRTETMFDQRTH